MLEKSAEVKTQLLGLSTELQKANFIDKRLIANSDLERDTKKLADGYFKIALVSIFSAGKSTFINSLLGAEILEVDERACTATVTRVKYMKDFYLEIIYNNGRKEIISGTYKGKKLTTSNIVLIKDIIKEKTTVYGRGEEEKVKEVILGYPFELCKNGVEIIDTPGLGARYEKHDEITKGLLLEVDAVIFLFEPTTIDNKGFLDTIKSYVGHAAASKLEEKGRHVFIVMNKSDLVQTRKRVDELLLGIKDVLKGILQEANPLDVSAYYALRGRQFMNKHIDLETIRCDSNIKIPNPEKPQYSISGESLKEQHIGNIITFSKILSLESRLGEYLEGTVNMFSNNLKRTIDNILKNNIHELTSELNNLNTVSATDATRHNALIGKLKNEIEILESNGKTEIRKLIQFEALGGTTTEKSLFGKTEDKISHEIKNIGITIKNELNSKWREEKQYITKGSADEIIKKLISGSLDSLDIEAKKFSQNTFLDIKTEIGGLIGKIDREYIRLMKAVDENTKEIFGDSLSVTAESRMKGLESTIKTSLEKGFKSVIISVTQNIENEISEKIEQHTFFEKKRGIKAGAKRAVNSFLGFFSKSPAYPENETYEECFNIEEFKRELDDLFIGISETIKNAVLAQDTAIRDQVMDTLNGVVDKVRDEALLVISKEVQIRKDMLDHQIVNFEDQSDKREKHIKEIEDCIRKSKVIYNKLLGIYKHAN